MSDARLTAYPCGNLPVVLSEIPRQIPGVDEVIVLVIDDGSTDTTAKVALENGADYVLRHRRNRGLSRAFISGVQFALALCLQAGPFDEDQAKALRSALRNQELPWDSYELRTQEIAGRWMVYLGKFPSQEVLVQRRSELRGRGVDTDRAGGSLEPGLSLGRFSTEEAATRELTRMLRAGVRGARVVQERAASTVYSLQLPAVTSALQPKIKALEPALAGKPLRPCSAGASTPAVATKSR